MAGHGEKRTRKQAEAIAALLDSPTIKVAAERIGLHEKTLQNWLKQPAFIREFDEAKRQITSHVLGRLQAAGGLAISTLMELATTGMRPMSDSRRLLKSSLISYKPRN